MRDGWYWVATKYACGAVVVKVGRVVETAPIYSWMLGYAVKGVLKHYEWKT